MYYAPLAQVLALARHVGTCALTYIKSSDLTPFVRFSAPPTALVPPTFALDLPHQLLNLEPKIQNPRPGQAVLLYLHGNSMVRSLYA